MTAPNLNSSNFTTEINVINPADYSATPYFTANGTGVYSNGILIASQTDVQAGSSGVAGTVDIYPATALKGKTTITASDNSGNTTTNIVTAAQTGARTYTVPDAGASASFVMTGGTQTVGGAKTLSSALTVNPTTNQLVLGVTNTTTINATAPASSRVYTLGDAGGAASFVLTAGAQTLTSKTLTAPITTGLQAGVSNALTAVGTNRGNSLALTADVNNVTSAAAGTGVTLPAGVIGATVIVFSNGANAIQVYGNGSDTIDTVAGSTGVPLTNTKRCAYVCVAANTIISYQLGVVSA